MLCATDLDLKYLSRIENARFRYTLNGRKTDLFVEGEQEVKCEARSLAFETQSLFEKRHLARLNEITDVQTIDIDSTGDS